MHSGSLMVLTPTGERHTAFEQCWDFMRGQSFAGAVHWVIVDDGRAAMAMGDLPRLPDNWAVTHVRPAPLWRPGQNTQARNLRAGLAHVPAGARLVIVEDDDQYEPWWLERCHAWLDEADLVGEAPSVYVNLKNGRRQVMANVNHASLCSTAMTGAALEAFRRVCAEHDTYIDVQLWKSAVTKIIHKPSPRGVVGRKGLPGRPGIGVGHRL